MKQRVKPFTLFLCIIILLFLVFGPRLIYRGLERPLLPSDMTTKKPEWSGIIKVWHVDYAQCGRSSVVNWLKPAIDKVESRYLDVFFDVRRVSPERLDMYFQEGIDRDVLPDIISLSTYENRVPKGILEDIKGYIPDDIWNAIIEPAQKAAEIGDGIIGLPYMAGWYTFMINTSIHQQSGEMDWISLDRFVEESSKEHFGFVSYDAPYSKPIYCVGNPQIQRWIESGKTPEGVDEMTYAESWRIFALTEKAGVFLGPTRAIYDMRTRQSSGKGFGLEIVPVPTLESLEIDQLGIYGVIKQENEHKKRICIDFLLELIGEDMQDSLNKIGMFSVRRDIENIYSDDVDMNRLEKQVNSLYKGEK